MRRAALALALALTGAPPAVPAGAGPAGPAASSYGLARNFQLVGHTGLGGRGVNSPVAVAGRCVYVGDRYDKHGIAIVDVSRPSRPRQVGRIPPVAGATQRELRADARLGLLVVMSYSLTTAADAGNDLTVYDIRNCARPRKLSTYDFGRRSPHEFFLWKDPKRPGRVLAYVAMTVFSPDLEVVDLTDPAAPRLLTVYDTVADGARPFGAFDSSGGYLHSVSVSDDGTRAYLGAWDWGVYVADTSQLAADSDTPVIRPVGAPAFYEGNVHGAVKVPGRPYAVLVQEGYAGVFVPEAEDSGCPFGWLRMVDLSNEALPRLTGGEYRIPENDCTRSKQLNGTFTSHNQTVFRSVALVPWYGGGLRAVDIRDPARPVEAGAFVPRPRFEPDTRDNRLYFRSGDRWTGAMWSYPVVQDGLVYVVDIDLGLYVLRYTGAGSKEVARAGFVEGNSAPGRYTRGKVVALPRAFPAGPPRTVRSPYADRPVDRAALARYASGTGFFCVGAPG